MLAAPILLSMLSKKRKTLRSFCSFRSYGIFQAAQHQRLLDAYRKLSSEADTFRLNEQAVDRVGILMVGDDVGQSKRRTTNELRVRENQHICRELTR